MGKSKGKVSVWRHHFFTRYEIIITVSNLPQWDIPFCKNEWKSGGAIRKVIQSKELWETTGFNQTGWILSNSNKTLYWTLLCKTAKSSLNKFCKYCWGIRLAKKSRTLQTTFQWQMCTVKSWMQHSFPSSFQFSKFFSVSKDNKQHKLKQIYTKT